MKKIAITPSITDRSSESIKRYLSEISATALLTPEQEILLATQARNGDKASADRLIKSHLRFVVSTAKQYEGRGLLLDDLIQEGNIGLMEAVGNFDPTRGYRFITYAVYYICKNIQDALVRVGRTIRIPASQCKNLTAIWRTILRFEQENLRTPSISEIADLLGKSSDEIADLMATDAKVLSLDTPFSTDEDSGSLIDLLEGDSPYADHSMMEASMREVLHEALASLSMLERTVLVKHWGLNGIPFPVSTEEIAHSVGLSCERVRQIHRNALAKIRTGKYGRQLKAFVA